MAAEVGQFAVADFVVFVASLAASLGIGIYFAYADRNEASTTAYMFGNRRMSAFPVSLSMAVTFISALTVLSTPVEVYLYGAVLVWGIVGANLGIVVSVTYYVPIYCRVQINTVYEILEMRFSKLLRTCIAVMANVQYIFYMGVASYIPALAISAVTPLSLDISILVTVLICTIYTTLGGMKAVIWTDVIQGLVMILGCISLVIKVAINVGGIGNVWEATKRGGRDNFFQATIDPRVRGNFPAIVIGYFMFGFSTTSTSQAMVQRYISCGNEDVAKRACYLKIIPMSIFTFIAILSGVSCYAYFEGCDPTKAGFIKKPDQMIPYLVVSIFKEIPGFAGLFVAAAFCGTLSTVSSGLNAIATVAVNDFILVAKPKLSEKMQLVMTKVASFAIGVCVYLVALLCTAFKGTVIRLVFAIVATNNGPMLSMFLYLMIPIVSTKGATGSLIVGLAFAWTLAAGTLSTSPNPLISRKLDLSISECGLNTTDEVYSFNTTMGFSTTDFNISTTMAPRGVFADTLFSLTPFLNTLTTLTVTVSTGIIISLITGRNKPSEADPKLFVPLISNKRFPKSWIKFFRFGVPESKKQQLDEYCLTAEEFVEVRKFDQLLEDEHPLK